MRDVTMAMASRLAVKKSTHTQHRHAVLVMHGRRIVGYGWNSNWKHAEIMAINHAFRDAEGATILSIRVRKSGELGLAKPCDNCMKALVRAGIKRVQYSTNEGVLVMMDV